jgi:hypothetical protein
MLEITKRITLKGATNAAAGDVQVYLEQLLVEVIAANYRQFLSEKTERTRKNGIENAEYSCWPPLFANERQVSGIFASGLNAMCPSTLAEHKIHRDLERSDEENELLGKAGRVDFMSSFGNRYIGLELKRVPVGITAGGDYTVLKNKWKEVQQQSKDAQTYMRQKEFRESYPNGTGVGLMVIRVAKQVSEKRNIPEEIQNLSDKSVVVDIASEIEALLKPDFFAIYTPPAEMQAVCGFGKNSDAFKIFPKILFAAVVHGKAESIKN